MKSHTFRILFSFNWFPTFSYLVREGGRGSKSYEPRWMTRWMVPYQNIKNTSFIFSVSPKISMARLLIWHFDFFFYLQKRLETILRTWRSNNRSHKLVWYLPWSLMFYKDLLWGLCFFIVNVHHQGPYEPSLKSPNWFCHSLDRELHARF